MSASEGFWLNLRTGKGFPVYDHAQAVAATPAKFGLTKKDIAGLNPNDPHDYDTLRMLALQRGWCRIRTRGSGNVTVESFHSPLADVVIFTAAYLKKLGFGALSSVEIHDLKGKNQYTASLQDLLDPEKSAEATKFADSIRKHVSSVSRRAQRILSIKESTRESAKRMFKGSRA